MSVAELLALLQLASPALPVGGYSYSQGLESAIDSGRVSDAASARHWIAQGLALAAAGEAALLVQQYEAWVDHDIERIQRLNDWLVATRESAELRQETAQMGWSLSGLIRSLGWTDSPRQQTLTTLPVVSYATAFACAAQGAGLPRDVTVQTWLFAWTENQVSAAIKTIPLGQLAGQRLLMGLRADIASAADEALRTPLDAVNTFSVSLGILSARHETQYSRLFRS